MPAITERQAKTQYLVREDGIVIGYSLKCASTFIMKCAKAVTRCGVVEAEKAITEGRDVVLVVRHPLDRLVSNYIFWRTVNKGGLPPDIQGPDRAVMTAPETTIEEWYEASQRHYNPHWVDQTIYHSIDGELVPNVVLPFDVLGTLRAKPINATTRTAWPDYFTPDFREAMEARYRDDVALYERALATWDGERPRYF